MSGFEIESFIISNQGGISYEGYNLFKEFLKEFPDTTIEVEKECGKSMIELGCFPNVQVTNPAISILETFQKLNTFVKSKGYRLTNKH